MQERKQLLMIDDDPDFVEGIKSILATGNYDVDVAYNPKDGLAALSLVASIAADALGAENVIGASMASRYSSAGSKSDAKALAKNLGIKFTVIPIQKALDSYLETLAEPFKDAQPDITEENIQARIRANILFALSNKFDWVVLACSNKSETATGYTTLYGDMAGGFIPLKDVSKTKSMSWRSTRIGKLKER